MSLVYKAGLQQIFDLFGYSLNLFWLPAIFLQMVCSVIIMIKVPGKGRACIPEGYVLSMWQKVAEF